MTSGAVGAGETGGELPAGGEAPIVARLALRRLDADLFEGRHPQERSPVARPVPGRPDDVHVFGGLILGQALRAAHRTVVGEGEGDAPAAGGGSLRRPASVQAAFLRAGRAVEPFRYAVERTRDGRAFSVRRVVASQDGEPVLILQATFQVVRGGRGVPGAGGAGATCLARRSCRRGATTARPSTAGTCRPAPPVPHGRRTPGSCG